MNISTTFALSVGVRFFSGNELTRESGVIPELSRSCKLHNWGRYKVTATQHGCEWEDKAKGSKSEDLPAWDCIRGFRDLKPE